MDVSGKWKQDDVWCHVDTKCIRKKKLGRPSLDTYGTEASS